MLGQFKNRIFGRGQRVAQPFLRHAIREELCGAHMFEDPTRNDGGRIRELLLGDHPHRYLHNTLTKLNQLRCTGNRMRDELASLSPRIRAVVMVYIAEQQRRVGAMHDQSQIATRAHGPEVLVFRAIEFVERQTRRRDVHLQVEGCRLDNLLFVAGEACEYRQRRACRQVRPDRIQPG